MHCDDKRTEAALRRNIAESEDELAALAGRHRAERDGAQRRRIRERMDELEAFMAENRDQLGDSS